MSDASENPVLFEVVDDHIALVRLNRPKARNALNGEVTQAIAELVDRIEANPQLRVAVLSSTSEDFFCAGADLKVVAEGRVAELRHTAYGFGGLVDARRDTPWIAAVNGYALGGGCELALACDMIVAGAEAKFGLPEVKRGIMANAGGVHRIVRALPRHIALEMVASGDPMDAARAERFGLANYVVEKEAVLGRALDLARSIAANAPLAVAGSLRVSRQVGDRSDAELRRISRDEALKVYESEDSKEGPRAFVEKRKPEWKGR